MALAFNHGTATLGEVLTHNGVLPKLFTSVQLGPLKLKNRVVVSPMCQYSCDPSRAGVPNAWHMAHYSQFALRGVALIIAEASAVADIGRITPQCAGLWNDEQRDEWKKIVDNVKLFNTKMGIQLAHAGRKASTIAPWLKGPITVPANAGGWQVVGPSTIPYKEEYPQPRELTTQELEDSVKDWVAAAKRADEAGFDYIEIHAAHGYLFSSILSPLSNFRTDKYGGSFENRVRLVLETVDAIRAVWPESKGLGIRLSASEWVEGGWDINDTVALAELLSGKVDMIDCSSGGNIHGQKILLGPGYQVPFAEAVSKKLKKLGSSTLTGTVGLILEPKQAEEILESGKADFVLLARQLLREPTWVFRAAEEFGVKLQQANQYARSEEISKWSKK